MKHIIILIVIALILALLFLATDQSARWQVVGARVEGPDGCGEKTCKFMYKLQRGDESKTIRVDARTYLTYGIGMWCEVPRLAMEPVSLNCYSSER